MGMRRAAGTGLALGLLTLGGIARAQEPAEDDALAPSTVEDANKLSPTKPAAEPEKKPVAKNAYEAKPKTEVPKDKDKVAEPPSEARTANNAVWFELLGNGGIYSINYERFFVDGTFGLRLGASYFPVSAATPPGAPDTLRTPNVGLMTFPLLFNYYGVGNRNHKLQLGAGVTFAHASGRTDTLSVTDNAVFFTMSVGYRYMPANGGFDFFVGLTPLFHPGADPAVLPLPGLGLGAVL